MNAWPASVDENRSDIWEQKSYYVPNQACTADYPLIRYFNNKSLLHNHGSQEFEWRTILRHLLGFLIRLTVLYTSFEALPLYLFALIDMSIFYPIMWIQWEQTFLTDKWSCNISCMQVGLMPKVFTVWHMTILRY